MSLLRAAALALAWQVVGGLRRKSRGNSSNPKFGCCPSGDVATDICGTCHYYLDGWCGESEENCAVCGSSWCSNEPRTCAYYGCSCFTAGRPCQCDSDCASRDDCCTDYYARCTDSGAADYWKGVNIEDRGSVKSRITKGQKKLGYGDLWKAYKSVWVGLPGKCTRGGMFDVYSSKCWKVGAEQCGGGGYKKEGDCYNREHSWPKSWWNRDRNNAYVDMFHVVPSDGYVNGKRSSLPFGTVDNPSYTSKEGNKVGLCSSAGFKGTCFEPTDKVKGLLARGHLYMTVRYSGEFGCCDKDGVSGASLKPWYLDLILEWHRMHPVEDWEREFNDRAQQWQSNRNPFIDFPQLADTYFK